MLTSINLLLSTTFNSGVTLEYLRAYWAIDCLTFLCAMFLTLHTKYFEEYADGTTPRVVRDDTKYITSASVKTFNLVFQKCNETKC